MAESKKDIARSFLEMASSGSVREAYAAYVHPEFRHHNPYFKGDRESLMIAMEENARQFPDKTYHVLRLIEEDDMIVVHGKVVLAPESQWSVIHILQFKDGLIYEAWEASQEVLQDAPNQNGLF